MSDPSIAAAQRAWDEGGQGHGFPHATEADLMIDAARQMAAPVRKLHKPIAMCGVTVCIHCRTATGASASWPCSSARLLYSSSELEGDSDAQ